MPLLCQYLNVRVDFIDNFYNTFAIHKYAYFLRRL